MLRRNPTCHSAREQRGRNSSAALRCSRLLAAALVCMLPTLEACSDVEAELDIEQAQALQQLESVNFQRSEIQMVVEGLQAELTLLEAQKATVSAELKEAKDGLARARAALEELPAKPGAPNDDR